MAGYNSKSVHRLLLPLLLFMFFSDQSVPSASSLISFNFTSFDPNNHEISYEKDAYPASGVIQLTLNERDREMNGSTGRATYVEPLHLWDKASGNLSDFTTHFSFVITSNQSNSGDGIAFFLAPNGSRFHPHTQGGGLGLGVVKDNSAINSTEYPFVAVEFDTFSNQWDPSDTQEGIGPDNHTHVGIDINSVKSVTHKLWHGSIYEQKVAEAWITYDAKLKNLSVSFKGYKTEVDGFYLIVDLREYLPEWVTFGFSATTGALTEKNSICPWYFNSSLQTFPYERNTDSINVGALVGSIPGACVVVSGLGLLLVCLWKRYKSAKGDTGNYHVFDEEMDDEFEKGTGPKRFRYHVLARATNYFSEEEKLGEGGFGGVYRGILRGWNSYVAIKRVSRESKQGIKEYVSEVKTISRLRHRNLVPLLGWCHEKRELLLVYEFMPNGSLDSLLFKGENVLSWNLRYKIAQGLASALLYLHEEWEQCVVHRDVKSSNIMLDSHFNARLGDFGLARLVDHEKGSQTTDLAGTTGYMAPECVITGKANRESDVYSFGIVALEIASGRRSIEPYAKESQIVLVKWVWELYGTGKILEAADQKLFTDFDEQEMGRLMIVGLWCAHPDSSMRPSIRQAIHVLTFEAPLPVLPSKIPIPTYFAPPVVDVSTSSF